MQPKKSTILFISAILILSIIPLIAAYNGFGFSFYSSPETFFENPWIMFSLIFIILFGVMFYVLNKSFGNVGVATAISIALSLFISMAVAQRGLLYEYGGGELSSWGLVIASLIAIGFLIRFTNENFGRIGTLSTVFIIWLILYNLDPYQVLPESLLNSGFFWIYDFLISIWGIIVLLVLVFIFSGEGPRTVADLSHDIEQATVKRFRR